MQAAWPMRLYILRQQLLATLTVNEGGYNIMVHVASFPGLSAGHEL